MIRQRWPYVLLGIVIAAYGGFVANAYRQGYADARAGKAPLYTDYTTLHAAAMQLRAEPAETLYLPRRVHEYQLATTRTIYGDGLTREQAAGVGYSPWMYPPIFILYAWPLAYLPYLSALVLWLTATGLLYVEAVRRIFGRGAGWLALAAPPAFFNIMYGQTGFLSAGLIGLGLSFLGARPLLAGALIGLASFKPHLGALLPLALLAGGHWRAFASASATVLLLVGASVLLLGSDAWYGFVGATIANFGGFAAGAFAWKAMTSVLSTAVLAGASLELAWSLQGYAAAAAAGLVGWTWWRGRKVPATQGLQAAVLCFATPLAIPLVYLYDLAIIVPGAAWLWIDLSRSGAGVLPRALVLCSLASLIAVQTVAGRAGVQLGAIPVVVLLGLALYRFRLALIEPGRQHEVTPEALVSR